MKEIRDKMSAIKVAFNKPIDNGEIFEVQNKLESLIILQDNISDLVTLAWGHYSDKENDFYNSLTPTEINLKADHLKSKKNFYCKEARQLLMKSEQIQKDNHYAIEGLRSILSNLKDERRNFIGN